MRVYSHLLSVSLDAVGVVQGHMGGASRGKVLPWQQEDVVQFLSQDGDSAPIYLWRERRDEALAANADPLCAEPTAPPQRLVDAQVKDLFAKYELGEICDVVCAELGVKNMSSLQKIRQEDVDELTRNPPKYMQLKAFLTAHGGAGAEGQAAGTSDAMSNDAEAPKKKKAKKKRKSKGNTKDEV